MEMVVEILEVACSHLANGSSYHCVDTLEITKVLGIS